MENCNRFFTCTIILGYILCVITENCDELIQSLEEIHEKFELYAVEA